jgi:hypothetical protein
LKQFILETDLIFVGALPSCGEKDKFPSVDFQKAKKPKAGNFRLSLKQRNRYRRFGFWNKE